MKHTFFLFLGLLSCTTVWASVTFSGTTGNVTLTVTQPYTMVTDADPGNAGDGFFLLFRNVYAADQTTVLTSGINYDTVNAPFTISGVTTSGTTGGTVGSGTLDSNAVSFSPRDFILGNGGYTGDGGDPAPGATVTLQPGVYTFTQAGLNVPDLAPTTAELWIAVAESASQIGTTTMLVPEPSTALLTVLGAFLGLRWHRARRRG